MRLCIFRRHIFNWWSLDSLRIVTTQPIEKSGPKYNVWYWEYPIEGCTYILSADIARGDSGDYSTFHVLNANTQTVAGELQGKITPDHFAYLIYDIAKRFNNAQICHKKNANGYSDMSNIADLASKHSYFS